ncbi:tRNA uridine-5-carboxymethylaminomethyl(34) synthesis GTPase MnmE [Sphingomonas sp. TREG-RG-20F-R18-01]|uniref:tRNA uridine-5-carboxymethylaminomethyl(34) synthesis GTPase MnmE n=1 Tax=Sphingomonas sp. TREG-RG-20F-R18-01 TaxID=2914982 RepID=UPI001F5749BA|nr:tRNA uridine-5-carboxymethylaminomethyl(34) synthesis GTPase MnmE [Sphingomonas sp. TREG-RG-20F-R18-01]
MPHRDTIYATSSGAAPAAIAIVRVSGAVARRVVERLAGSVPEARRASLRALRHPATGTLLDRAVVLFFPGPATATGEDLVEFHIHGGRAVIAAVEAAIGLVPETRLAEAGEFTRRALANGRIDLTEAEGLGDLLAAQTETQRKAALRVAEGGLRAELDRWTDQLVAVAAEIEAALDFSDEDDVSEQPIAAVTAKIANVAQAIDRLLGEPPVERLHDGIRVVIAGPPNSGKSTLLNALTGRDVAIVSAISGTTRDRIEATVVRSGVAYVLTDTAGLTDQPGDEIEQIGIDRARSAMAGADIVLWLDDTAPIDDSFLAVHARADVVGRETPPTGRTAVAAKDGRGIAALWDQIDARARRLLPQEDALTVNSRQRGLLAQCVAYLHAALHHHDMLVVAEELRGALRTLDAVAGRSGIEHVLGSIFARFCIGK